MYIAIAIIAFGLLIMVHELGHFIAARIFKVKVNEFALGMGPKILKWRRGDTLYSLRALPFGGFCAMEGEDGDPDNTELYEPERSFINKSWWKRCIILIAGALANFVLGYLILVILFATARIDLGFLNALRIAWNESIRFVGMVYEGLVMLFSGRVGVQELSGPVGIVTVVNEVAEQSTNTTEAIQNVAYFFSFIAVNLGIMNLLPIPALDGGRVFSTIIMTALEKIARRKLSHKIEGYIHVCGLILLFGLMAFTVINDVTKIVNR